MIHPNTNLKFINKEIGHGVVATKFIPAGTITWAFDRLDRVIPVSEIENMEDTLRNAVETYMYRNKSGNYVLCWDNGRFMNHSFHPNCMPTAYNFEVAVRDIQPGEQLTNDYGCLNIIEPFNVANEGTKRNTIYPNDLLSYHKVWDEMLSAVFPKITLVEQALKPILSEEVWCEIKSITKGKSQMKSILNNYFEFEKQRS